MSRLSLTLTAAIVLVGCKSTGDSLGISRAKPTTNFPAPWGMNAPPPDWNPPAPPPPPKPQVASRPEPEVRVASTQAPEARPKQTGLVAVLPLNYMARDIDADTQLSLEETIRNTAGDVLAAHGYTVLTGETTLAVLADNNISAEKACEASCALSAARELKARLFLSGTVTRSEGALIAFIRLFETDTGRQLSSIQLEGETVRSLRQAFEAKAETFVRKAVDRM